MKASSFEKFLFFPVLTTISSFPETMFAFRNRCWLEDYLYKSAFKDVFKTLLNTFDGPLCEIREVLSSVY